MKTFLLVLSLLSFNSLFAQTPLSLEEVKSMMLKNAHLFNHFTESSVYRQVSKEQQTSADGKVCEYEEISLITILLAPKIDSGFGIEIYTLTDYSEKPLTENTCGDDIKSGSTKGVMLFPMPTFSLQDFRDLDLEQKKYFLTDEGLVLEVNGSEKCLYDYNVPLIFNPIRCENETGIISSTSIMPNADLEKTYDEIKDFKVTFPYTSGPESSSFRELSLTFGEILKNWKNSLKN